MKTEEGKKERIKDLISYIAYGMVTVILINFIQINVKHDISNDIKLDHRTTAARMEINHQTPYGVTIR